MENKELVNKSQLKRDIFYANNMDASLLTMGGKINHKKKRLAPKSEPALPLYIKIITLSTK
jgi:hypothetical protein